MEDTKITAKLPHLDLEIRHRELPEDGAEEIIIRMQATPSFDAVGASLMPALSAMTSLNPMMLWMNLAQQAWRPWLTLMTLPSADRQQD